MMSATLEQMHLEFLAAEKARAEGRLLRYSGYSVIMDIPKPKIEGPGNGPETPSRALPRN